MAGPLSSEEIEDVVSSVRRLVSNELSPRRHSRDLGAERLLLTPSLRVVSEASALSPLILAAPLDVAVAKPAAVEEPLPPLDLATPNADEVELIEAEWEDELWVAPEVASLGEVALGTEDAEVLMPPAEAMADAFAQEPEADDLPEAWAEVGTDWAEEDPVPFVPLRRRAENLAARAAAGELGDTVAPVAESAPLLGDVDPALYEDLSLEDVPIARDAAAEVDRAADASEDTTHRMPTEIIDADGTPLAVLDEAALQEIVRQMIREELQGTLGERITRNVRKLVRAEIHRALIARDLD